MASWKGAAWAKAASEKANAIQRQRAAQFAADVLPIIRAIEESGGSGYSAIARALNARGIPSARGGVWHATAVRNIILRDLG
jgi:recombinase